MYCELCAGPLRPLRGLCYQGIIARRRNGYVYNGLGWVERHENNPNLIPEYRTQWMHASRCIAFVPDPNVFGTDVFSTGRSVILYH